MLQRHTQRRLLIDCNSFFAACEVMRNPSLRGKPVCVWRDIILAASYEAKFFGVYTGLPVWEAKKLLPPETVYCGMDMQRYVTVSKRLIAFLRERFDTVLPASIDESFIRCDDWITKSEEQVEQDLLQLQQDILQEVWLPVSIWIAPTKLLAKIAADYKKPLWYTIVINDYQRETLLADLSINDVPYIGSKTTEKLSPYVKTALWYANLSLPQVKTLLGHHWAKIRYELNAVSVSITQLNRDIPWWIGRTRSFNPHFSSDGTVLWHRLQNNITRARKELYAKGLGTISIAVSVKSRWFKIWKLRKSLPHHTNDFALLMSTAHTLFLELLEKEELQWAEMRATGIFFRELWSVTTMQPGLFSYEADIAQEHLNKTIFSTKQRFWKRGVHLGTHALKMKQEKWGKELEIFSSV